MKFTVYILYSEKFNKHYTGFITNSVKIGPHNTDQDYTGFTSNIESRIKSHNEFGKDWTGRYRPWKLMYTKEFESKTEAMTYEKWLKTGAGRDFIKTLSH